MKKGSKKKQKDAYPDEQNQDKNCIYIKNIAPFDVERIGKIFKVGKETRIPMELYKLKKAEIRACPHLKVEE